MNLIRFLYFIPTIVTVVKSSAEADDVSLLTKAKRLFDSKHLLRGSGLNSKRMLEVGTKRLLQLIEINLDTININIGSININLGCNGDESNDYDDDNNDDNVFNNDDNESNDDDESSNPPMNELVTFLASDGSKGDRFGASCSMSDELILIGAPYVNYHDGAAYLFHLNGTEILKLTPDEESNDVFGFSVSMDEKIVVGSTHGDYIQLFSRNGTSERTIRCNDCIGCAERVATLGNLIVTYGKQNSTNKLFVYSTEEGQLLKTLEQEDDISDVAVSEQFIASTARYGKTFIYSNTSPDFPKITEINQSGKRVAISNDRLVIGYPYANDNGLYGGAWLYKTDGTLVTALDRQHAYGWLGWSVAITDDKVMVGAQLDDGKGYRYGSVFIYSAVTGDFIKNVVVGEYYDNFGNCVSASGSYFVVGALYADVVGTNSGAAYLFQLSE